MGIDLDQNKIATLKAGKSYIGDVSDKTIAEAIKTRRFVPTSDFNSLRVGIVKCEFSELANLASDANSLHKGHYARLSVPKSRCPPTSSFAGQSPSGFPLLLFSYPIVLWARHLIDDEKAEEGRATTFWLLALFAFLIPAVAFAISQFSPLSVWHARHLIIAAVPYMLSRGD